ncbi:acyltransferase [Desulforhopalus sp. 52FAK]
MTERKYPIKSHGTGTFSSHDFKKLGDNVIFESEVLVFHPENIEIASYVYVGHQTILKAYHQNTMAIGEGTWIGQQCFFHSAGGIKIGRDVGIGPGVKIISSEHEHSTKGPILHAPIKFSPVNIEDDCDIGVGAIIMPGVTIGEGTQIGAGAVVTKDISPYSIATGVPARVTKSR